MRKNPDPSKYLELPHSRAYQRHRFEEIQHGRTFVDRHYYRVLMEAIEKNPDGLEELVQFLWINTSLGNWSYVLRALELKVKLAGKEKGYLNYEEMLNSLGLAS